MNTAQTAVHSEENDRHVSQHAADDDKIVEMWTRHFDVSLIAELDVHN